MDGSGPCGPTGSAGQVGFPIQRSDGVVMADPSLRALCACPLCVSSVRLSVRPSIPPSVADRRCRRDCTSTPAVPSPTRHPVRRHRRSVPCRRAQTAVWPHARRRQRELRSHGSDQEVRGGGLRAVVGRGRRTVVARRRGSRLGSGHERDRLRSVAQPLGARSLLRRRLDRHLPRVGGSRRPCAARLPPLRVRLRTPGVGQAPRLAASEPTALIAARLLGTAQPPLTCTGCPCASICVHLRYVLHRGM